MTCNIESGLTEAGLAEFFTQLSGSLTGTAACTKGRLELVTNQRISQPSELVDSGRPALSGLLVRLSTS